MGKQHVPAFMLLGRGEITTKDVERVKNNIKIGDQIKVEGLTRVLKGTVVKKHKHFVRVGVPGQFKAYCIQYKDLVK